MNIWLHKIDAWFWWCCRSNYFHNYPFGFKPPIYLDVEDESQEIFSHKSQTFGPTRWQTQTSNPFKSHLGGGNSNIFWIFIPTWGRWTQFDEHIGLKPPTSHCLRFLQNCEAVWSCMLCQVNEALSSGIETLQARCDRMRPEVPWFP